MGNPLNQLLDSKVMVNFSLPIYANESLKTIKNKENKIL